jgi:nucleotidyltransferase substrate binding protein (TIGR01987 family)
MQFTQVLSRLKYAIEDTATCPYRTDATVKRFEMTFEFAWKVLLHILNDIEKIETVSPRNAIKEANKNGLIADQNLWLKMIDDRNLSVHLYSEGKAQEIIDRIPNYVLGYELLIAQISSKYGDLSTD